MQVSEELAATHYGEHVGKSFYPTLIEYITSAPVMAMAWEGKNAVAAVRQTLGATKPTEAAPGTIGRSQPALAPQGRKPDPYGFEPAIDRQHLAGDIAGFV